jgi:glyoxylase-like metal-dependent hydrolase (beta-lactamase superfamily II)
VLVDTCTPGCSEAIGRALVNVGAAWANVTDIVLTHSHFDHLGGLAEVSEQAPRATIWAGAQDTPEIPTIDGRVVQAVAEGDRVGELRVMPTPGHTAGSHQLAPRGGLTALHRRLGGKRGRCPDIRAGGLHR